MIGLPNIQNARPVISRAPRDVTNRCFAVKRISCFVFEFSTRTRDSLQYSHELAGVSQFENFGRACNVSRYFSVFVMSTLTFLRGWRPPLCNNLRAKMNEKFLSTLFSQKRNLFERVMCSIRARKI